MGAVGKFAGGAQLVGGESVVDALGETAVDCAGPVVGGKRAAVIGHRAVRRVGIGIAAFGEKLNHGAGGFCAEQGAFRAADHLHAIEAGRGEIGEVDGASGLGDRNAVQQDQRRVGIAAAREQVGQAAADSGLDDIQAGDIAQQILDEGRVGGLEIRRR